jgi:hypothetical protein
MLAELVGIRLTEPRKDKAGNITKQSERHFYLRDLHPGSKADEEVGVNVLMGDSVFDIQFRDTGDYHIISFVDYHLSIKRDCTSHLQTFLAVNSGPGCVVIVMNPESSNNSYYANVRVFGKNLKLDLVERNFKFVPRPINLCIVADVELNTLSLIDATCACTLFNGQGIYKGGEVSGSCACYSRQQGQRCPIILLMGLTVRCPDGK